MQASHQSVPSCGDWELCVKPLIHKVFSRRRRAAAHSTSYFPKGEGKRIPKLDFPFPIRPLVLSPLHELGTISIYFSGIGRGCVCDRGEERVRGDGPREVSSASLGRGSRAETPGSPHRPGGTGRAARNRASPGLKTCRDIGPTRVWPAERRRGSPRSSMPARRAVYHSMRDLTITRAFRFVEAQSTC
jgi:hypothetical protein